MKVLVYLSEKENYEKIMDYLDGQEFSIVQAKNQDEVNNHLLDDPDLIIADFDEEDGGISLVNLLLAANKDVFPYVIFLAEESGERFVIDALGPIPGDLLIKPFSKDEFLERVSLGVRTIALQSRLVENKGYSDALALYDHLTNVLNRQALYDRGLSELARAKRENVPVSLAMIEILNLEEIEEKHGKEVVDQGIRFVARVMRANVRMYDLVGRWIGAKFLIILPGLDPEHTKIVTHRLFDALSSVLIRDSANNPIKLNYAMGTTSCFEEHFDPFYVLLDQVNIALRHASKEGGGIETYSADLEV